VPLRRKVKSWLTGLSEDVGQVEDGNGQVKEEKGKDKEEKDGMRNGEADVDQEERHTVISSNRSVASGGSKASAASMAKLRQEVKAVELKAQASAFKRKMEIEEEELRLAQITNEKSFRIRQVKEDLEMQSKIELAEAKSRVFEMYGREGNHHESYLDQFPVKQNKTQSDSQHDGEMPDDGVLEAEVQYAPSAVASVLAEAIGHYGKAECNH
jgi:hypothetical protein